MKIVIAEDDAFQRLIICRALQAMSFEVTALSNGQAAWEHLCATDAQVLITDWMMPGLDGIELCRKIRDRASPEAYLYIIVLTALDSRTDRLSALEAGADDLLTKPLDRAELHARLKVAQRIIAMKEQLRSRTAELERMQADLEERNTQLAEMATSDGLTGLRNHRYFRESLETQFASAQRNQSPLSVIMFDVDKFKSYNDTFGHPSGDEVLREIGRILRSSVRDHDIVARYGGEEFASLLPSTDVEASLLVGQRLRKAIKDHPWPLRPITISLGIATMPPTMTKASILLEQADRSLYQSKAGGRNQVTHANDLPEHFADRRRSESAELELAAQKHPFPSIA